LLEVIINVTIKLGKIGCKFLVGKLERDFVRLDRDKFSAWGFTRVTCQRFDVNLTGVIMLLM